MRLNPENMKFFKKRKNFPVITILRKQKIS